MQTLDKLNLQGVYVRLGIWINVAIRFINKDGFEGICLKGR